MKPTIMDGSKSPAVVIQTPELTPANKPSSSVKKYVAVGVSAVLVTMILTAGLVTTGVLFSKTNADIIKSTMEFKDALGSETSEEIEADLEANTATYTVRGANGKMTVVHDYNKKLGVLVFHDADEPYCAVHFLNTTQSAKDDIVDVNKPAPAVGENINVTITRDQMPVVDVSFLPAKAVTLCADMDTYWVTETYGEVLPDNNGGREKRANHLLVYVGSVRCSCGRVVHIFVVVRIRIAPATTP